MQKTEKEIIQETIDAYTVNTRSLNELERCVYLNSEGKKCALGRCLTNEGINIVHERCETISAKGIFENRDIPKDIFKPEYLGHSIEFWTFVQDLHDTVSYWDEKGLSRHGYFYIKLKYPDFEIADK